MNNPLNFIDVNGDSVWIHYNDADGNDQRMLYTQGMEYSGDNEQLAGLINSLNQLNGLEMGNTVLTSLTGSTANYNMRFGSGSSGSFTPFAIQRGTGGNIILPMSTSAWTAGHELFHAYQHEYMGNIGSTAIEVGAHLFEASIYSQLNLGIQPLPFGGSETFNQAFGQLLDSPSFNQNLFNIATNTFLQSQFNMGGSYNRFKPIIINNPVISNFFPLNRGGAIRITP